MLRYCNTVLDNILFKKYSPVREMAVSKSTCSCSFCMFPRKIKNLIQVNLSLISELILILDAAVLAVGRKEGRKKERQKERQKESKTQNELKKRVVRNIPIYCREVIFIRYRINHHSYYIFHIA